MIIKIALNLKHEAVGAGLLGQHYGKKIVNYPYADTLKQSWPAIKEGLGYIPTPQSLQNVFPTSIPLGPWNVPTPLSPSNNLKDFVTNLEDSAALMGLEHILPDREWDNRMKQSVDLSEKIMGDPNAVSYKMRPIIGSGDTLLEKARNTIHNGLSNMILGTSRQFGGVSMPNLALTGIPKTAPGVEDSEDLATTTMHELGHNIMGHSNNFFKGNNTLASKFLANVPNFEGEIDADSIANMPRKGKKKNRLSRKLPTDDKQVSVMKSLYSNYLHRKDPIGLISRIKRNIGNFVSGRDEHPLDFTRFNKGTIPAVLSPTTLLPTAAIIGQLGMGAKNKKVKGAARLLDAITPGGSTKSIANANIAAVASVVKGVLGLSDNKKKLGNLSKVLGKKSNSKYIKNLSKKQTMNHIINPLIGAVAANLKAKRTGHLQTKRGLLGTALAGVGTGVALHGLTSKKNMLLKLLLGGGASIYGHNIVDEEASKQNNYNW